MLRSEGGADRECGAAAAAAAAEVAAAAAAFSGTEQYHEVAAAAAAFSGTEQYHIAARTITCIAPHIPKLGLHYAAAAAATAYAAATAAAATTPSGVASTTRGRDLSPDHLSPDPVPEHRLSVALA